MHSADWPRGMAEEAIDRAIDNPGTTIREAMFATQIGMPTTDQ